MTRQWSPDIASDEFDRLIAAWMDADAHRREPEGLLEATLARTGHTRRRPSWLLPERWIPMQLTTRLQPVPRMIGLLVILGLIVALAAAVFLIGSWRPVLQPFGLAGNGRIAFVSEGDLYTANPDGTNAVPVTSGPEIDGRPIWSHVGSKVALFRWSSTSAAIADLMVLDVDSKTVVRIAEDAAQLSVPSWSPDDRMLAFSQDGPDGPSVYTARSDGSAPPTRLEALGVAEAPIWSPDGARIAYAVPSRFAYRIYVADADGTDPRPITGTYGAVANAFSHGEMGLAWSPDGGRILFAAGPQEGSTHLYVVDAAGDAPEEQLTFGRGTEYGATWSPDGMRIAYIASEPFTHGNVMVANADGSDSKSLIDEKVFYLTPHWSPDGTTIVVHPVAENEGIWLVDSQTGSVRVKLAYTPASYEDDAPGSADIWSFERVSP
jgi:Tol biopolymer transport system component